LVISGLCCGNDIGSNQDVVAQELRQFLAGGLAIVGCDCGADVVLILSKRWATALASSRPAKALTM
jgi:hypothetical protein